MSAQKKLTKKQRNHLITLGTLVLGNKELIELTAQLRQKYKINLTKKETEPETYREELAQKGVVAKIRKDALEYFEKMQSEEGGLQGSMTKALIPAKNKNAKEVWNELWPVISEGIRKSIESQLEELTVAEALAKFDFNFVGGEMFLDEYVEFVVTDDSQAFPEVTIGAIITEFQDMVIAVGSPLSIQNELVREFKMAMREKFPGGARSWEDTIGAACVYYHNIGLSDKEIALKIYDPDPNRRDFDEQLRLLSQNIRKKRKRIKEQIDKRL